MIHYDWIQLFWLDRAAGLMTFPAQLPLNTIALLHVNLPIVVLADGKDAKVGAPEELEHKAGAF
jgi:hypothetical protein